MKIQRSDYVLMRFAQTAGWLLRWLGNRETNHLLADLDNVSITQPVFITGLARSGTTILLTLLSKLSSVATHRYRDFPFLMIPYVWNRYLDRFSAEQQPVERAHRDRIYISPDSPEAFEEPLWQHFFPHVHEPRGIHLLGPQDRLRRFDDFFVGHIRKVLYIRGGTRYVSKGNYNFTRIGYLSDLFADARFIIPIRHPLTHVDSLVRKHRLFCEYAQADPRVPRYLAAAGHYEFGPQRVPVRLYEDTVDRVIQAWQSGDDYAGYAVQWAHVYRYLHELFRRQDDVSRRLLIVRYEDFCEQPAEWIERILQHSGFDVSATHELGDLDHISKSPASVADLPAAAADEVWRETEDVASRFGYERACW